MEYIDQWEGAHSKGPIIPWNKGRLVGPKPPLKLKEIWGIRVRLQLATQTRDLALFNLAIDSKLRGCDLVRLKVLKTSRTVAAYCPAPRLFSRKRANLYSSN
ncbi:MAG: hypothetical protein PF501_15735 [Salinisphaera sp.]|jgi:hypothetical protein|nr:hypothetical protein [Salinisphaera sp.]